MRSHVDPTLAAFIVCGPLQFLVSYFCLCREIKISVRVRGLPIDINVEPLIIARNKGVEEWQLALDSCSMVKEICGSIEFSES